MSELILDYRTIKVKALRRDDESVSRDNLDSPHLDITSLFVNLMISFKFYLPALTATKLKADKSAIRDAHIKNVGIVFFSLPILFTQCLVQELVKAHEININNMYGQHSGLLSDVK